MYFSSTTIFHPFIQCEYLFLIHKAFQPVNPHPNYFLIHPSFFIQPTHIGVFISHPLYLFIHSTLIRVLISHRRYFLSSQPTSELFPLSTVIFHPVNPHFSIHFSSTIFFIYSTLMRVFISHPRSFFIHSTHPPTHPHASVYFSSSQPPIMLVFNSQSTKLFHPVNYPIRRAFISHPPEVTSLLIIKGILVVYHFIFFPY